MHILKNKKVFYNLFLIIILLIVVYKVFLENKISMQNSVKLTSEEVEKYTLLAKDNNQSAIKYLWAYYAIYKKDEKNSCYWWFRKIDRDYPPRYCFKFYNIGKDDTTP